MSWDGKEYINPFSADVRIFQENYVNTMATDALAPLVARSSAAMALTKCDKWWM